MLFTSAGIYIYFQLRPPTKVFILVAAFEDPTNPGDNRFKVTEEIVERLRFRTRGYLNVEVRTISDHFKFSDGEVRARAAATHEKATMIIWGNIASTDQVVRLNVNIELLAKPSRLTLVKDQLLSYVPLNEVETYKAQIRLSDQLSFLTLIVDGLIRADVEDYDGAIERFSDALSQPDLSGDLVNLADVYYFRASARALKTTYLVADEAPAAIEDLDAAIALKPNLGEAFSLRGWCYFLIGQRTTALREFSRAAELNPRSAINYLYQGFAYSLLYKYKEADDAITKAVEQTPEIPQDFIVRGLAFLSQNSPDSAIKDFEEAILRDPSLEKEAMLMIALTRLTKGEVDEAERLTTEIETRVPNSPWGKLLRIFVFSARDRDDLALREIDQAISQHPSVSMLYSLRGQFKSSSDDLNGALEDFNRAVELNPERSTSYYERAECLFQKKDWTKALADIDVAIRLDPESAEYRRKRGDVFLEMRDGRSSADYRAAIRIFPLYRDAYIGLARSYARENKFGSGEISDAQIGTVFPDSLASIPQLKGISYYARGLTSAENENYEEAVADLSSSIPLLENFYEPLRQRAEAKVGLAGKLQANLDELEKKTGEAESKWNVALQEYETKSQEGNALVQEAERLGTKANSIKQSIERIQRDVANGTNLHTKVEIEEILADMEKTTTSLQDVNRQLRKKTKEIRAASDAVKGAFEPLQKVREAQLALVKNINELYSSAKEDSGNTIDMLKNDLEAFANRVAFLSREPALLPRNQ
jgi:tetratricopeptide (TPR) repeat protein